MLDLCAGTGDVYQLLLSHFEEVIGADFCLPMLHNGTARFNDGGLGAVQGDALKLPFNDQ